ncbi:MAG: hypothetical protein AB7V22_05465 [Kiritimatiellia bacterium]
MKKTLWIAMVGALVASVVAASAQEVLSANAVGYIKKTLPPSGGLVMMSIPLDSMTEASNVFGRTSVASEAPQNSTVFFWDEGGQIWSIGSKGTKGWQPAQSNQVVIAGQSFFLKSPTNAVDPADVTITGEVPPTIAQPVLSRNVPGVGYLSTLANPYPVDFKFGESQLAQTAAQGSSVFFWDSVAQGWSIGSKGTKGWQPAQSNQIVAAGDGFFLKSSNATSFAWSEPAAPYTWP